MAPPLTKIVLLSNYYSSMMGLWKGSDDPELPTSLLMFIAARAAADRIFRPCTTPASTT